jgi:fibronectin-binding autotransporter adhesin
VHVPRSAGLAAALGLLAWVGLGAVPAASAAVRSCTVTDASTHARYTSLQAAVNAASPGATLLVGGTCIGTTEIQQNLTVTGQGVSPTLNGDDQGSVLIIDEGASVTINRLTITRGGGPDEVGGGIYSQGTAIVNDTIVTGNSAPEGGGGIWNDGTMTLNNDIVTGNSGPYGGGIYNDMTLTLNGLTSVIHNAAGVDGGGIANGGYEGFAGGTVTLNNLAAADFNTASGDGGGIYNYEGTVTFHNRAAADFNIAKGGPDSGGGIYSAGTLNGAVAGRNVFGDKPDDIAGT